MALWSACSTALVRPEAAHRGRTRDRYPKTVSLEQTKIKESATTRLLETRWVAHESALRA